jgi:hypothetical protein
MSPFSQDYSPPKPWSSADPVSTLTAAEAGAAQCHRLGRPAHCMLAGPHLIHQGRHVPTPFSACICGSHPQGAAPAQVVNRQHKRAPRGPPCFRCSGRSPGGRRWSRRWRSVLRRWGCPARTRGTRAHRVADGLAGRSCGAGASGRADRPARMPRAGHPQVHACRDGGTVCGPVRAGDLWDERQSGGRPIPSKPGSQSATWRRKLPFAGSPLSARGRPPHTDLKGSGSVFA